MIMVIAYLLFFIQGCGKTALFKASSAGQTETVTLLLDHGVDIHAVDSNRSFMMVSDCRAPLDANRFTYCYAQYACEV